MLLRPAETLIRAGRRAHAYTTSHGEVDQAILFLFVSPPPTHTQNWVAKAGFCSGVPGSWYPSHHVANELTSTRWTLNLASVLVPFLGGKQLQKSSNMLPNFNYSSGSHMETPSPESSSWMAWQSFQASISYFYLPLFLPHSANMTVSLGLPPPVLAVLFLFWFLVFMRQGFFV